MSEVLQTTEGPDRCRGSLNCRDLHDADPNLSNGRYNCCCCNTCLHLRPGVRNEEDEWNHCCRCVPRSIWAVFEPYNDTDECCQGAAVRLQYGSTAPRGGDAYPVTTYSGELFGVTITVEVGRFIDQYEDCAWRVNAYKAGEIDEDHYYTIDHSSTTCIDVSGIEVCSLTARDSCEGAIVLDNDEVGRIPFQERPSDTEPEFIELYPPCGNCTQVVSKLCVYGNRMAGHVREWVEYEWFDYGENERGWHYSDPITHVVETIYLEENEYSECMLTFDWPGSTVLDDRVIDWERGCSCGLKEVVTYGSGAGTIGFTIRSGRCGCWDFFCGTCRCVPRYLCVNAFISVNDNVEEIVQEILTWDEEEHSWLDDERNTEYGLYLKLQSDGDGNCEIVAVYNGEELDGDTLLYDCGDERLLNEFDPDVGVINGSIEIAETEVGSYRYINIHVSSNTYDCQDGGNCLCHDSCGGTPDTLVMTFTGWNDPYEDEPGITGSCAVEVTLHKTVNAWGNCEYIGFTTPIRCTILGQTNVIIWKCGLDGMNQGFSFNLTTGESSSSASCDTIGDPGDWDDTNTTSSCDPFLYDSGVQTTNGPVLCCVSCQTTVQRWQLTITESDD